MVIMCIYLYWFLIVDEATSKLALAKVNGTFIREKPLIIQYGHNKPTAAEKQQTNIFQ